MVCENIKDLCPFFAGNTINYDLVFKRSDGSPIDISGMVMTFTMKINKSDPDSGPTALQQSVTFQPDDDSGNGLGSIEIPAGMTSKLIPDRWYQYDFQLLNGPNKYTIGIGRVFVKQKVRTA